MEVTLAQSGRSAHALDSTVIKAVMRAVTAASINQDSLHGGGARILTSVVWHPDCPISELKLGTARRQSI